MNIDIITLIARYIIYTHVKSSTTLTADQLPYVLWPMHKAKGHLVCLNLYLFPLSDVSANGNTYATVTNSYNSAY